MKKFKKFFAFFMMLPMAFGFSACKDKNDNTDPTTPVAPGQTTPVEPQTPVVDGFKVSYDYNLPEEYKFLMSNPATVVKEAGETVICPTVSNASLESYFLGWFNESDEEVSAVTGELGDEFAIKGKWNTEALANYYYSTGLQFVTSTEDGNTAEISGYTGSSASVIIPKYYKYSGVDYKVESIANSAFVGTIVENVVNNATDYSIGSEAFKNTNILSFDFSEVTEIGSKAFENCSRLKSVELPTKLLSLGSKVFNGCVGLKDFSTARLYEDTASLTDRFVDYVGNISQNVENLTFTGAVIDNVPSFFFESWTALKKVQFNDTINSLGEYCFVGCENIEEFVGIEKLNPDSFLKNSINNTKYYRTATTPLIIQKVLVYAPVNTLSTIDLSAQEIVRIQPDAFSGNTTLVNVKLPGTLAVLGQKAFYGCTALETVDFALNANLTTIPAQAFEGCTKLVSVNLTNLTGLTTLSKYAFSGTAVANFVIPETVETIDTGVFRNAAISSFEINGESSKFSVVDGVLYNTNAAVKTLVAYPKMKAGESFAIPADVTNIAPLAFAYSENLKYVKFLQNTITWDYYLGAFNRPTYDTFKETKHNVVMLSDSALISSPLTNKIHYLIADPNDYSCVLDGNVSIELAYTFEMITGIYTYYIYTEERYFIITIDAEKEVTSIVEITDSLA